MSKNNDKIVTVRFNKPVVEQNVDGANISRISGFMSPIYLLKIVKEVGLEANPRYAHQSPITRAIMETLKETPDLFPFKSKGVLIGASKCEELERERYRLTFSNIKIEGVLDGGHNIFAIIKYLFEEYLPDISFKAKNWLEGVQEIFNQNYDDLVNEIEKRKIQDDRDVGFVIPVEIIKPKNTCDDQSLFTDNLIDICGARNNNAQLTDQTKDNKAGIYDYIKEDVLPEDLVNRIIWKTGENGDIPSTEIIALSWIVLKNFDKDFDFQLNKIYSSKGDCIKKI